MRAASEAVAEALFSTEEGPPPSERLAWLVEDLDDFVARAGARARLVYLLCLVALTFGAPLLIGRLSPIHRLSASDRMEALTRAERGAMGMAVFGAKALLSILYYEHADAARAVGFDGACLLEPAPRAETQKPRAPEAPA